MSSGWDQLLVVGFGVHKSVRDLSLLSLSLLLLSSFFFFSGCLLEEDYDEVYTYIYIYHIIEREREREGKRNPRRLRLNSFKRREEEKEEEVELCDKRESDTHGVRSGIYDG